MHRAPMERRGVWTSPFAETRSVPPMLGRLFKLPSGLPHRLRCGSANLRRAEVTDVTTYPIIVERNAIKLLLRIRYDTQDSKCSLQRIKLVTVFVISVERAIFVLDDIRSLVETMRKRKNNVITSNDQRITIKNHTTEEVVLRERAVVKNWLYFSSQP